MCDDDSAIIEHLVPSGSEIFRPRTYKMGVRHCLVVLGFLGFLNIYAMRVNLSVAIVAMTNDSSSSKHFSWDSHMIGLVLGSFFYGYITTQLLGGYLAQKFGGKIVYTCGCLVSSIFTLLAPLAAEISPYCLIAARILVGMGQGVTFPSMNLLLSKWSPTMERSKLSAMTYTGTMIGTVISLSLSGVLCQLTYLGGWPLTFYLFGVTSSIWLIFWHYFIYESPDIHPTITETEKAYIRPHSSQIVTETETIPWHEMIRSPAVWGIIFAHVGNNWGFYTLLTEMPSFMSNTLKFSLSQNSFLSALPYLLMWVVSITCSHTADYIRANHIMSTEATRKLFNSIGLIIPAAALIGVSLSGTNTKLIISFLYIGIAINGAAMSGYGVNHIDIAPNYAGILMGLTNTLATAPGIFSPYLVGLIVGDTPTLTAWHTVFEIASVIYVLSALIFVVLASGSTQPWNRSHPKPL